VADIPPTGTVHFFDANGNVVWLPDPNDLTTVLKHGAHTAKMMAQTFGSDTELDVYHQIHTVDNYATYRTALDKTDMNPELCDILFPRSRTVNGTDDGGFDYNFGWNAPSGVDADSGGFDYNFSWNAPSGVGPLLSTNHRHGSSVPAVVANISSMAFFVDLAGYNFGQILLHQGRGTLNGFERAYLRLWDSPSVIRRAAIGVYCWERANKLRQIEPTPSFQPSCSIDLLSGTCGVCTQWCSSTCGGGTVCASGYNGCQMTLCN